MIFRQIVYFEIVFIFPYSLNVHDMLKHKTLVLTKSAVEYIEEKILFAQRRMDIAEKCRSSATSPDTEMPFYNTFCSLS